MMPIADATSFRRECAQIPRDDLQLSRNGLSHEVLGTWAAVYNSFSSQKPR
jgi:hypothetical protein